MIAETQKFLSDHLGTENFELSPIKKGGSDRSFFRVCLPDQKSFIFMHYGIDVAENAYWANITTFLRFKFRTADNRPGLKSQLFCLQI